jgi:hypothetical protein
MVSIRGKDFQEFPAGEYQIAVDRRLAVVEFGCLIGYSGRIINPL